MFIFKPVPFNGLSTTGKPSSLTIAWRCATLVWERHRRGHAMIPGPFLIINDREQTLTHTCKHLFAKINNKKLVLQCIAQFVYVTPWKSEPTNNIYAHFYLCAVFAPEMIGEQSVRTRTEQGTHTHTHTHARTHARTHAHNTPTHTHTTHTGILRLGTYGVSQPANNTASSYRVHPLFRQVTAVEYNKKSYQ